MLWTRIIKAIPFILQVILVVIAVALFAFFDPFGIFIQTKNKLKDTPVDVRSVRDIGQLITAEYYGEVIGSYAHEIEQEQDTARELYHKVMLDLLSYYTQEINELSDLFKVGELKRRDIYDAFNRAFEEVVFDPDFETLLYFISNREKFKASQLDSRLSSGQKKKLIREAVRSGGYTDRHPVYNASAYLEPLFRAYEQRQNKDRKKRLKKKNLVMLGRGWVKAGFDFGSFTERNFKYDNVNGNIYFIGFNPSIISATINPWFIPERGVEGFEFLLVERKSRRDYKVVQLVKQRCLDELVRKAHEREIMMKAKENARASLKAFFTLLIDEDINEVIFYDNEFDYVFSEISENDSIEGEELLLIDHMLSKKSIAGMDEAVFERSRAIFVDSLNSTNAVYAPFGMADNQLEFPMQTIAYAVCRDGVFDEVHDTKMISNFSRRYCALSDSLENFTFSCNTSNLLIDKIVANTNILIGRSGETTSFMIEHAASNELDSLLDDQGRFVGLQLGRGEAGVVKSVIEQQLSKACAHCDSL